MFKNPNIQNKLNRIQYIKLLMYSTTNVCYLLNNVHVAWLIYENHYQYFVLLFQIQF